MQFFVQKHFTFFSNYAIITVIVIVSWGVYGAPLSIYTYFFGGRRLNQSQVDIERVLNQGQEIQLKPQGYSMYPMIIPGRDEAIIRSADHSRLKKGDVVLYRRESGILVLHRIYKRKKDEFYMVGDNQKEVEGPLVKEQIKGILTGFIRNGKYISVKNPVYILASRLWLFLRPVRPLLSKSVHALKHLCIK